MMYLWVAFWVLYFCYCVLLIIWHLFLLSYIQTVLFTDGSSVFVCETHDRKFIMTIQIELNKLFCWLSANKISLNYEKT